MRLTFQSGSSVWLCVCVAFNVMVRAPYNIAIVLYSCIFWMRVYLLKANVQNWTSYPYSVCGTRLYSGIEYCAEVQRKKNRNWRVAERERGDGDWKCDSEEENYGAKARKKCEINLISSRIHFIVVTNKLKDSFTIGYIYIVTLLRS